ncbi:hypothetical protein GCM10011611_09940 [Aliidongia dinghuensis]|uniref:Uncharacterized protein n=1 Tax=Aliidongia dinghuensis TaxID=1867774 RepID=A0A8J2YR54_9PROT|nr:hypothetical protein [Aliidongia dinghuensis]GGF06432.1 hypothetical protein GCM10011611_09940 [Aliidongia dinghuensis]
MSRSFNGAGRLRPILEAIILGGSLAACALSQASDPNEWRSVTVVSGRFNRDSIVMTAHTPVTLEVGLKGLMTASIRSPELGIEPTLLPTNPVDESKTHAPGPGYFKTVKIPIQPLAAGKYQIVCDCGGHEESLPVIIRPEE